MILAIINIYNPGPYMECVRKNLNILRENKIHTFISVNDGNKYSFEVSENEEVFDKGEKIFPGAGFNAGMKFAINNGYDRCYFIDQDSLIKADTISELVNFSRDKKFSFLASEVIDENSGKMLRYFRGNLNNSMTFHSVTPEKKNHIINAAGYSGIMVNLDVVKKNELIIDESFDIELDDYDFTYRLSKILPGFIVNTSQITHPNKKDSRNNWLGETIDAYLQLFFMNRKGRNSLHIRNYQTLIKKYGIGPFANLKLVMMKSTFINTSLIKIKEIMK